MRNARSAVLNRVRVALKKRAGQGRLVLTASLAYRRGDNLVKLSLAVEGLDANLPAPAAVELQRPFADFGARGDYRVPANLLEELAAGLRKIGPAAPMGPLWLRLVRPCGYLGLLPWEACLFEAMGRPVLRLPDFPYRAAERTGVLENIVLVDPPENAGRIDVANRLKRLATSILAGSTRSGTRVHVFASAPWQQALAADAGRDPRILLHAPPQAPATPAGRGESPIAPWIDWILGAMERRGADAIHILGRAAFDESGACVRLSASPCERPHMRRDVDLCADDLAVLLNRAGAWSASLVPARLEYAMPMAYVADDLAHRWHGAVLFSDLGRENPAALREATRLLYTAETTAAPRLEHGFLYCHPDFLLNKRSALRAAALRAGTQAARLVTQAQAGERFRGTITKVLSAAGGAVPDTSSSWVAATQRFVEKEVFDELRRQSGDVLLSQVSARVREQVNASGFDEARARLLDQASAIVAAYRPEK
ncbi:MULTISPECIES: hypothetical protein [unclassified Massilia]|uniref:hypothetical protein n=1 Tax=unclassified Massilia TaxID=2609279 RepID=UPI00178694CC|nr:MULTISPECIES: hypothetical protein [unclassified Massilia]MBD8529949.1 hypothetical protein [Massilia sp. CFBP 13647]MBD8673854.1 hypothetical protein [Massilia sp. CFBP 13721]